MMKNTPEDKAVTDQAYETTGAELRQFIERIEQLEAEKRDIAEQVKEVFTECKGRGYDAAAIRKIVAERKRRADDVAEEEAIIATYKLALGMQ